MTTLALLGPEAVFDHVGVAVRSIREVAGSGIDVTADPIQRVRVAFVDMGGLRLELIEPFGVPSPIDASLDSGRALVHLCFRVPDLQAALARARRGGLHQIARPAPAPAFGGRPIAWVFCRRLGLIELVEDAAAAAGSDAQA
jgi:methylmalonyl-CoA/ethylmalonyl-CoA epimerase